MKRKKISMMLISKLIDNICKLLNNVINIYVNNHSHYLDNLLLNCIDNKCSITIIKSIIKNILEKK